MSDKEYISILNAPINIHYTAISIFVLLLGLFYVFTYTSQFTSIKSTINKWKTTIFGSKQQDVTDPPTNNFEINEETINEINELDNVQELLSPF